MLGQDDMDPSQLTTEEIAQDPRAYSAKNVPQRMGIISAGVIMNALFAFGVSRLGTFIPISPGGLGTVDGVLAALLVSAGNASAADALAAVLIWRTLTFLPGMALGSASFVAWRRRSAAKLNGAVVATGGSTQPGP